MKWIIGCLLGGVICPQIAAAQVFPAPSTIQAMRNKQAQAPLPPLFRNEPQRLPMITHRRGEPIEQVSWILAPAEIPEEIKIHDIVLVLVDERAVQRQNRQFQRQKQGVYNITLADWIRINSDGNLDNAAENEPTIDVNYENRLQARGNQNVLESLTYRIAASVTSIRPNGNLIIGARKSIVTNRDAWVYHLTGEINPKHIDARDTVKSEYIYNLNIIKRSTGKVRDSVKRGWMTRVLDHVSPF